MRANKFRNTDTLQAASPVSSWDKSNTIALIVGFVFIIAVFVFNRASLVHGAIGSDAMTTVRGTVSQVLNILNYHQSSQQERRRRLISLVARAFGASSSARFGLVCYLRALASQLT